MSAPPYSNDERLTEAQREQADAAHHALQNRGSNDGGGGGGAALGAVLVPMVIIGTFVIFMFYACFYPVGATIAIATALVISKVFDALVPGVGWIGHYLLVLPFAFAALMIYRKQEVRFEQNRGYRITRHVLRLVFTAVIVGMTTTFLTEMDTVREGVLVDGHYSWTHFAIVVTAVALVHFVGRWQDRRIAQQPVGNTPRFEQAATSRSRMQIPGMELMPVPLQRGLPVMTVVGGLFGAFLGYAAWETSVSTLVGLFAGCVGGALLMFVSWLITRPVGALFDRVPLLWPLLMGAMIGVGIAWRLAQADQAPLPKYLVPGLIGGALVLTVPYLLYAMARRLFARPSAAY